MLREALGGCWPSPCPRRRLPVVVARLKMAEIMKESVTFVEQGHVRVGPTTVTDPAILVTRSMASANAWFSSVMVDSGRPRALTLPPRKAPGVRIRAASYSFARARAVWAGWDFIRT